MGIGHAEVRGTNVYVFDETPAGHGVAGAPADAFVGINAQRDHGLGLYAVFGVDVLLLELAHGEEHACVAEVVKVMVHRGQAYGSQIGYEHGAAVSQRGHIRISLE